MQKIIFAHHGQQMSSTTKSPDTLVIADQERLHGIFDLSGIPCEKAFTLDEGLKVAQRRTPALLFVQSRLGGFSGEIIARHIRLELKDKKMCLVLLCGPEDMPEPGSKAFSAAMDVSLPDEQLADQVRAVAGSFLSGKNPKPARDKMGQTGKSSPGMEAKPAVKARTDDRDYTAGKERREPPAEVPQTPPVEPLSALPEPAAEIIDIVNITSRNTNPSEPGAAAPPPAESPVCAARFREELENALGKTIAPKQAGEDAEPGAPTTIGDLYRRPSKTGLRDKSEPESEKLRPRITRTILILSVSVALLGGSLLWLHSGTHSALERQNRGGEAASGRKISPAAPRPVTVVGKTETKVSEPTLATAEEKPAATDVKYLTYTIRQGDTVFTILTKRFGLSPRMAESLIPQVLEKNGISRSTVLSVGRELLIPENVKIQPVIGRE